MSLLHSITTEGALSSVREVGKESSPGCATSSSGSNVEPEGFKRNPSAVEVSQRQKQNLGTKAKVAEAVNWACQAELIAVKATEARSLETQARFAATKAKTERVRLAR